MQSVKLHSFVLVVEKQARRLSKAFFADHLQAQKTAGVNTSEKSFRGIPTDPGKKQSYRLVYHIIGGNQRRRTIHKAPGCLMVPILLPHQGHKGPRVHEYHNFLAYR